MRVDGTRIKEMTKTENKIDINISSSDEKIDAKKTQTESVTHGLVQTKVEKPLKETKASKSDVVQAANDEKCKNVNANLKYAADTMTLQDAKKANDEGYDLGDTDVETIVTVVDEIKIKMAEGGADTDTFGVSKEAIKKVTKNASWANEISRRMHENDIPANDRNVSDAVEAKNKAETLKELSDGEKKYLIENEMQPTIENLYIANNSGMVNNSNVVSISDEMWQELRPQIEKVIINAGLEINDSTIANSKWLISRQIPLTTKTLSAKEELDSIELPPSEEKIDNSIIEALKEGKRPDDATLGYEENNIQRAKEAISVIENADDEKIKELIADNREINIKNLGEERNNEIGPPLEEKNVEKFVVAKRHLEEIRLMMTVSASVRMLKMGIEIETQELSSLVEKLKAQEKSYYESLFSTQRLEANDENIQLFKATFSNCEEVKKLPEYILGRNPFVESEDVLNIENINREGQKLKAELDKTLEKYEQLMTKPRSDMGDTIKKAFGNVEDILKELDIPVNDINKKAVRILAYNNMEITGENIDMIKEADIKVSNLINKMTPPVVMQLIRDNINPLKMDINELSQKIDDINNEMDFESVEKYSEFLWKAEHNKEISKEERDSYIGIYRLLRSIEKNDSAAVGALVNQNAVLSLKNLLSAVRSSKNKGMDYTVDDEFGSIESKNLDVPDIDVQIDSGFVKYNIQCAKEILNNISPDALDSIAGEKDLLEMSLEELAQEIRNNSYEDKMQTEYLNNQVKEYEELAISEENIVKLLVENDIPVSQNNIIAAGNLLNNRNTWYEKILNAKEKDIKDVKEQIIKRFAEAVKTPEEMAKAVETLAELAEDAMKGMIESEDVTSVDLKGIKLMHKELSLMKNLAKNESYTIPVMVGDSFTGISLKIVRGENEKGKVNITFETSNNECVGAELLIKENSISGLIVSKNEETLSILSDNREIMEKMLSEENGEDVDLKFAISENLDIVKYQANAGTNESNEAENKVQTKRLYDAAKSFIYYVTESFSRYKS